MILADFFEILLSTARGPKTYAFKFLIEDSIKELEDSKELKEAFGEDVINSYIKLKKEEIDEFNRQESFNKKDPITEWERKSTLDC